MASASDHHAHAALQPADCLILLPQRLPAAVETSIGPAHYPPSAPSQTRSFNRACAPLTGAQTLIRFMVWRRGRTLSVPPPLDRVFVTGLAINRSCPAVQK